MSIRKFKQFESKGYEYSYKSSDFTELEEIWSIILDLNIEGVSDIKIFKYWCEKNFEFSDNFNNDFVRHAIISSHNYLNLDKVYSISISLNKKIFLSVDRYSDFSDDFFVACGRLGDMGTISIDVDRNRDNDKLEYKIGLKVKRK